MFIIAVVYFVVSEILDVSGSRPTIHIGSQICDIDGCLQVTLLIDAVFHRLGIYDDFRGGARHDGFRGLCIFMRQI